MLFFKGGSRAPQTVALAVVGKIVKVVFYDWDGWQKTVNPDCFHKNVLKRLVKKFAESACKEMNI